MSNYRILFDKSVGRFNLLVARMPVRGQFYVFALFPFGGFELCLSPVFHFAFIGMNESSKAPESIKKFRVQKKDA